MATKEPNNVTVFDDKAGNHFWIFTIEHITGTVSTVDVENSVISAQELTDDGTDGGAVTIADTSGTDSVKEITVASAIATGTVMIVARFGGVAGTGSGHGVL